MASDAAVELWDDLSQLFSDWEIDHASSDQIVDRIRAALDAARAEEREACAEACDRVAKRAGNGFSDVGAEECAAAIRGR